MRFVSTRGRAPAASLSVALTHGLAPDGGLYVPEHFPSFSGTALSPDLPFPRFAADVLDPFFEGDDLHDHVGTLCKRAFSFPILLVALDDVSSATSDTAVLELFHGPTAAFKDVGARFLAECLQQTRSGEPGTAGDQVILVATSGDTGGAVAAAFHKKAGIRVGILFPDGGVSERQEKQLTTWGDNVSAFALRGTFDDCQRVLKGALAEDKTGRWTTANSINIARLLPQTVYYAWAAVRYRHDHGSDPGFIVPSGNVGNALAALWAKAMGFPVRSVVMAVNSNRTVSDYLRTGVWEPRPAVKTLANAMDVGDPSNMERVLHLFPDVDRLRAVVTGAWVDDETIRKIIAAGPKRWNRIWDPHTAVAVRIRDDRPDPHWIIVATAHPAKFPTVVEPLVGTTIPVPDTLAAILARPGSAAKLEPDVDALIDAMA